MPLNDEPQARSAPAARTLADWYVDLNPRVSGAFGALLWSAAIVALVLYANRWLFGIIGFSMIECWLIGSGCLGVPVLILQLLGKALSPAACMAVTAGCFGIAGLLTFLISAGDLQVSPIVGCFSVIMPEALGIHALNAAATLTRIRRAVERARAEERAERARDVEAAYLAGIAASHARHQETAHDLAALLAKPSEQLEEVSDRIHEELDSRRKDVNGRSGPARILKLIQPRAPQAPAEQERPSGQSSEEGTGERRAPGA